MVSLIVWLLVAPFTILTFCFAVEVFAGLRPLTQAESVWVGAPTAVIIVPAHDEEQILAERLGALKSAAEGLARILLVADNCSDLTAQIARHLGVEVIERAEPVRRGKGFALDFAKQHLRCAPPDIVLVIDADCTTDAASIDRLVVGCAAAN